jgi:hypothetical protein
MAILFDGVEYLPTGIIPAQADNSIQFLLSRVIAGKIKITKGENRINQNFDYSELPYKKQNSKAEAVISKLLVSEGVGINEEQFIQSTLSDNRDFFREILAEFSNFFIQTARKNHTSAFLHIYRILERSSYSIPLLYSKTQKDFLETFTSLKEILNDDDVGELGFLNRFITQTRFIDSLILDASFEIKITSKYGYEDSYFDLAKRLFKKFEGDDRSTHKFQIKFRNVQNLIVALRNRTFHASTGDWKKNARMQEIIDTDEFFSCFNQIFVNFLAIIIIRIISVIYKDS